MPPKKQEDAKPEDQKAPEEKPVTEESKPEPKPEPTRADLDAKFDRAVRKMKRTVSHPIDRLDDEVVGVSFPEPEIEQRCKILHRAHGDIVLGLIEKTLGGCVTYSMVSAWEKRLRPAKAAE